jgi:pimeloyl-ACP methyl ester carboxylesterase
LKRSLARRWQQFFHKLKFIKMNNPLQTFNTNGVTLHYTKIGTGQPLLFIPGSVSDYRTWTNIQQHFADKYECYIISRRFQFPDKYPTGGDSSVAVNTTDIATFIKEKNLSPAVIVGHSFGGYVALNVAIQFPEIVKCIVAEEPFFTPALAKNPKNPLELIGLMFKNFKAGKSFARLGMKCFEPTLKALAKGDTTTAQKIFIVGVTDGKKTPSTLDELSRLQLADNIAALAGDDPFNNTIKMDDLQKIKCPTLLISGTESPYVFQYINEQLKKFIRQSQLVSFINAGHWIHIDQADKYVVTVTDFLKR